MSPYSTPMVLYQPPKYPYDVTAALQIVAIHLMEENKQMGEMMYQEMRDLVEVSDVAYCSRSLSKSYIALWYVS